MVRSFAFFLVRLRQTPNSKLEIGKEARGQGLGVEKKIPRPSTLVTHHSTLFYSGNPLSRYMA